MKTLKVSIVSFATIFALMFQGAMAQVTSQTESELVRFSLQQAQEYAVKNANVAKNADLNAVISKKRTLEIITEGLPQVSGAFNYQNTFKLQTNVIPAGIFGPDELRVQFGNPFTSQASVNVDQLLVDGRYFLG